MQDAHTSVADDLSQNRFKKGVIDIRLIEISMQTHKSSNNSLGEQASRRYSQTSENA